MGDRATLCTICLFVWKFKTAVNKKHIALKIICSVSTFRGIRVKRKILMNKCVQIKVLEVLTSVQSLSRVLLFASPWIAARQASLSTTNYWSPLKLMSIELVMASSHLILCCPLLLLPPIPPSIRVFSNESTLRMRWPKYCSFSFSISPPINTQDWSPLGCSPRDSLSVSSNTTI